MVRHVVTDTILGPAAVTADGETITGAYFEGSPQSPRLPGGTRVPAGEDRLLDEVSRQLRDHVAGVCLAFDMMGADDLWQAAWEIIARGPLGWDRGPAAPGSW